MHLCAKKTQKLLLKINSALAIFVITRKEQFVIIRIIDSLIHLFILKSS